MIQAEISDTANQVHLERKAENMEKKPFQTASAFEDSRFGGGGTEGWKEKLP